MVCGSLLFSDVRTGIIMNGNMTCTRPITTADDVYSSDPRPIMCVSLPIGDMGLSSMLQPKARTTSEISSGDRMTSRNTEFHGAFIRLRIYDSGTPISTQMMVTRPDIHRVRQKTVSV